MSREIKFRVWDSISKKLHSWDSIKDIALVEFQLEHYTLEQFTGLTDKNGKDIYEGDIIQNSAMEIDGISWIVEFNSGCFGVRGLALRGMKGMEVIGNVHQNKDLLK